MIILAGQISLSVVLAVLLMIPSVHGNMLDKASPKSNEADQIEMNEFHFELLLGSYEITSPVFIEEDLSLNALPIVSYYGDRFYFENTNLGFSLIESSSVSLDLVGRYNLDGLYFESNRGQENTFLNFISPDTLVVLPRFEPIPEVEDRQYSYMGGLKTAFYLPYGFDVELLTTKEVTNHHGGMEHQFSISNFYSSHDFSFGIKLGWLIKDKKLSKYYYDIRESEIGAAGLDYELIGRDTVNPFISVMAERQFNDWLSLYFSYQFLQFDKAIEQSIFVQDPGVTTRFIGVKLRF